MKEEGGRVGGGEEGCGAWMVGSDMMVYIHIYTYISSSVGGWVVELQARASGGDRLGWRRGSEGGAYGSRGEDAIEEGMVLALICTRMDR